MAYLQVGELLHLLDTGAAVMTVAEPAARAVFRCGLGPNASPRPKGPRPERVQLMAAHPGDPCTDPVHITDVSQVLCLPGLAVMLASTVVLVVLLVILRWSATRVT